MAVYQYSGTDKSGKNIKGKITSESKKTARQQLKKEGVLLFSINNITGYREQRGKGGQTFFKKSVPLNELTLMTRQLASLVKANVPLIESITAVLDQSENETMKLALSDIRQNVNEGTSFSKALSNHPNIFTNVYINMVGAGESSGTLPLVLVRLADFLEAQSRLRSKIVSAMVYPTLMIVIGGALMLGIFTFVIPKIAKIFASMRKDLPWYTELMLSISDFAVSYWWLIILVVFGGIAFFRTYLSTKTGIQRKDRVMLRLPIVGPLVRMIAVSRFANTMATLLSGGVPIVTSLGISKAIVNNYVLASAISKAQENITEGNSLVEPLKNSKEFPPLILHMVAIGEKTGDLPHMLEMVSQTYEEQVNIKVERFTALLEPVMIIFMGLSVGIIVLSVFTPLLQLQELT